VTDNVRALEGALIRIVALHSLTGRPIDRHLAAHVLDGMYPPAGASSSSLDQTKAAVASFYGISIEELLSPTRVARVSWPRQVAIHLARELTDASLHAIADAFGGRNHATVLHACKRVSERLMEDPILEKELADVTASVTTKEGDRLY